MSLKNKQSKPAKDIVKEKEDKGLSDFHVRLIFLAINGVREQSMDFKLRCRLLKITEKTAPVFVHTNKVIEEIIKDKFSGIRPTHAVGIGLLEQIFAEYSQKEFSDIKIDKVPASLFDGVKMNGFEEQSLNPIIDFDL